MGVPRRKGGACFSLQSFLFAETANKKVFPLQSLTQLEVKTKVDFNSTLSNCGNYLKIANNKDKKML